MLLNSKSINKITELNESMITRGLIGVGLGAAAGLGAAFTGAEHAGETAATQALNNHSQADIYKNALHNTNWNNAWDHIKHLDFKGAAQEIENAKNNYVQNIQHDAYQKAFDNTMNQNAAKYALLGAGAAGVTGAIAPTIIGKVKNDKK